MSAQLLYMNVYRAGHYHRQGKPLHTNLHGGDLFTTRESALAAVDPDAEYLGTVATYVNVPEGCTVLENPEGSVPTPLSVTRGNPLALLPWHTHAENVPPILSAGQACGMPASREVGDDYIGMSYEEWRRERERTGFKPAPQPHAVKVAALLRAPDTHGCQ